MTKDEADQVFDEAYTNALIYGIGMIRIVNTAKGPIMAAVSRSEYEATAEHLRWVSEHTMHIKDQPQ